MAYNYSAVSCVDILPPKMYDYSQFKSIIKNNAVPGSRHVRLIEKCAMIGAIFNHDPTEWSNENKYNNPLRSYAYI
jgi:hypothetical protein